MDKFAAAHILEVGPTLKMSGEYAIPPGSGVDPQLDEEGKEIEDDSKPPLPSFPKYEGMTFVSKALPDTVPDVHFPPLDGLVRGITLTEEGEVPVTGTPVFTVPEGIKA
ncbi:hypothetical protein CEUSTIGMA_g13867.t1 [Chlamydomonas eustigma]|uniref:Uncharacterized protein n=1 Tax=Chlamydomonas eustigma TaxID=1157962 RepID=A0A250XTR5_9CHLO|nr:hypothetical protein CEUSTIGMA_g13867.t1 [Chlamydomonas eustigma]|eukprot:GAX86457.1 hypothetical protein CEUSTIGMA_g13867.t1 [Chlamydomonas eustigma]